jgi:IS605 OrfB family transposase
MPSSPLPAPFINDFGLRRYKERMEEQKRALKLKLKVAPTDFAYLQKVLLKYRLAVNFFLARMYKLRSENPIKPRKERVEGICSLCQDKKEIFSEGKLGKLCGDCWKEELSFSGMRKRLIPAPRRKRYIPAQDSVYVAIGGGLSPSLADTAFSHAEAIFRSWEGQMKRNRAVIRRLRERLTRWKEVMDNATIKIDGKEVSARVETPKKKRQREPRYRHVLDDPNFRGLTLTGIKRRMEKLSGAVAKLERRIMSFPKLTSDVIWLKNTSLKILDMQTVRITCEAKHHITAGIWGVDVEREKSRDFLLGRIQMALETQKSGTRVYPQLLLINGEWYLYFPLRWKSETIQPGPDFAAVGIDRGVNAILAVAAINREGGSPHHLWLESGKGLWKLRSKEREIRTQIQKKADALRKAGKRFRLNRKIGDIGERKYVNLLFHQISKNLVKKVLEMYPDKKVVLVMENLKGLREGERKAQQLRYKLNTFGYQKLQSLICYKASDVGIPVYFVEPAWTSVRCSKCGHVDNENRKGGYFRCTSCGYSLNADLNAAINIANKFYQSLNIPPDKK